MKIQIFNSIEQAGEAKGLTVVIDVFRAFTTACYVFANGAKKIIPVDDIELAYKLKRDNPKFVLMGERGGRIQPGFDFGNSPSQIEKVDFTGKTVVQTTSAGTQGLAAAVNAQERITGSFVNVRACIEYIKSRKPDEATFLCTEPTLGESEDMFCAEYMRRVLLGRNVNFDKIVEDIRTQGHADEYFDPSNEIHPEADFRLCMALDRFNFVLKAEPSEKGLLFLKKIEA